MYQTIKKLLVERLPKLRELSMGCEVKRKDGYFRVVSLQEQEDSTLYILSRGLSSKINGRANIQNNILITKIYTEDEVLGHDPSHADLLKVLGEEYALFGNFELVFYDNGGGFHIVAQLPKDLHDLDLPEWKETSEKLISLITK